VIVMKFGGTSVANAERMLGVCELVQERLPRRPVVVTSALAGVTDLLERMAASHRELEAVEPPLAELERRHRWAVAGALDGGAARHDLSLAVDALFDDLRAMLRSIRTLGELSGRARDSLLAFGEKLASTILAAVLREQGIPATYVDPCRVLVTDAGHGAAEPDLDATTRACAENLAALIDAGQVPVVGGFVGATAAGVTTTLGRGGSDTSAAVLGAALGAEEIQIWTDVDGLMSADPRLVPEARTLARVSFAEAAELAFYGARVLHPSAVWPAVERAIPVRVLNALAPSRPGTEIVGQETSASGALAAVASRTGVRPVRITNRRLRLDPTFLPAVLDACARAAIVPDLVLSSEIAVTLVVPVDLDIASLTAGLGVEAHVESGEPGAVVCAVGNGLCSDAGIRGRVLDALAALDPWLVAFGASSSSIVAVVGEDRLATAVRRLHREFFEEVRRS
jgi:aspartate kinase